MLKNLLAALIALALTVFGTPDGGYFGFAAGYGGPIGVVVHIEDGVILSVEVTAEKESRGIGDMGAQETARRIVERQSFDINAVSGATVTSEAVCKAVEIAVRRSGQKPSPAEPAAVSDFSCDVLVGGATASGLCAALILSRAGYDVAVCESNGIPGESDAYANGLFSFEQLDAVEALLESAGVTFVQTFEGELAGYADSYGGAGLITALYEAAISHGVRFIFDTEISALTTDSRGAISGALLSRYSTLTRVSASALILCFDCCDTQYTADNTAAVRLARQAGAAVRDGITLTVEAEGIFTPDEIKAGQSAVCGQLSVNGDMNVLRESGAGISGLYAAGAEVIVTDGGNLTWGEYLGEGLNGAIAAAQSVLTRFSPRG